MRWNIVGCPSILARDVSGQLLDGDWLAGVQEEVHFPDGVLASRDDGGSGIVVAALLKILLVVVRLRRVGVVVFWLPGLVGGTLLKLVEDADWPVLPDSVADLQGIDPHGQFWREGGPDDGGRQAAGLSGLNNDWVEFSVDSDTPGGEKNDSVKLIFFESKVTDHVKTCESLMNSFTTVGFWACHAKLGRLVNTENNSSTNRMEPS